MTIKSCSSINPFSNCKVPGEGWTRIEKDLYLDSGIVKSAYLFVKQKKPRELEKGERIVVDVRTGRVDPSLTTEEKWESRPSGLWLKFGKEEHAITAIEVLFGPDAVDPRLGWEIKDTSLTDCDARLTIRRGIAPTTVAMAAPRINSDGKFKILQLADLHLSTGVGVCRDAEPKDGSPCEADTRTLEFVEKILDDEKPDMVVLSGDQINGDTAPDAQTAIFKYAEMLIKRKIPYATIFGNHDDEQTMTREAQMSLIESLPYSLSRAGPADIDGVGNYYVEVLARGHSTHSALTLYFLDTHAYSPDEKTYPGYNWLKENQINWFKSTAKSLKRAHQAYTHIHMDLAFIHIPLPEYREEGNERVGEWREGVTAPTFNSGFRNALVEEGVVMVSCGHDHANDYCALSKEGDEPKLWMCFGGGAGFGGYGGYGGYHRRVRVFEVDMNQATISTHKRVEWGETGKKLDPQVIVANGRAVAPVGDSSKRA
jgi:3',5'-cyclic AMP phosphodiesterase CpdA